MERIKCIVEDEGSQIDMEFIEFANHAQFYELPEGRWTFISERVGLCRRLDGSGIIEKVRPEKIIIPDTSFPVQKTNDLQ